MCPKKSFMNVSNLSLNLENRMTVCMGYPAMTPQGRAGKRRREGTGKPCGENGASDINRKWPVDVVNDTKRHSPETSSTLQFVPPFNVFKLNTLILSMLRLTSTRHFVKSRWNLVSTGFLYFPDYCNTIALWWVTKTVTHHLSILTRWKWWMDKMSIYHSAITKEVWLVVILICSL